VLAGNASANLVRNLWGFTTIFCGHFPDLPSHRYAEIAVEVREIRRRYGLPYNVGPLRKQFGSVVRKIARLALPTGEAQRGKPPFGGHASRKAG
jgi:NADPH-dependent stearoyl-CoA 9-desaturase